MEIQKRKPGRPPRERSEVTDEVRPVLREADIRENNSESEDILRALREESLRSFVERDGNVDDPFYVPEDLKDPRFTYEWKATHIMGKELDAAHQASIQQQGWVPAPAKLFKQMLPKGATASVIERGGQMLFMRPKELTDRSRLLDKKKANDQVKSKMQALGMTKPGELDRKVNVVKKSYESMEIPE